MSASARDYSGVRPSICSVVIPRREALQKGREARSGLTPGKGSQGIPIRRNRGRTARLIARLVARHYRWIACRAVGRLFWPSLRKSTLKASGIRQAAGNSLFANENACPERGRRWDVRRSRVTPWVRKRYTSHWHGQRCPGTMGKDLELRPLLQCTECSLRSSDHPSHFPIRTGEPEPVQIQGLQVVHHQHG